MKKILLLCLFLFGCDGVGVFSHGHSKGICIHDYVDGYGQYRQACYEDMTENECISKDGATQENYHTWRSTNLTCDKWEG